MIRILDPAEVRLCKRYARLMGQPWRPLVQAMNQASRAEQDGQIMRMEEALRANGMKLRAVQADDKPEAS